MAQENWSQVKELLQSALENETEQRAAFLDSACAGNPSLKAEVESLIALSSQAAKFLETPIIEIGDRLSTEEFIKIDSSGVSEKTDSSIDLLIGRTLGEFTIKEKIGEGGFGVVYRAEQFTLARQAVVKVMHARHRGEKEMVERFIREAKLASRLEHPYTAHVYAFGAEADGLLWIAMEFVHGTPLDKLLQSRGTIPLERFVPLLDKICEVVHTAHECGIVHRDIKPANVMVISRAGRLLPKLLDFGIAKLMPQDSDMKPEDRQKLQKAIVPSISSTITEQGATTLETMKLNRSTGEDQITPLQGSTFGVIGSPNYMAPEQWVRGELIDARSDIYSLGVLVYEVISGHPPFKGSSVANDHIYSPVPPLGDGSPSALDEVMAKVMAKRPGDRFQTAIEFAAALREATEQRSCSQPSETDLEHRSLYPGLNTFTTEDAEFFFGRERETEVLLNRLQIEPLLTLLGPSGAGKSSFIQAGLIPALEGWRVIAIRPGYSPLATLSAHLVREGIETRNLSVALEHNPNALREALQAFAEMTDRKLLLFVDQFEELFTLCSDQVEQHLFAEAIARSAQSAEDPVRVVITLRDDFLMRAQRMPVLGERLARGLHLLNTPDREDLLKILTEPARQAGYEFEDRELPREIVDSVAERTGALPLIAFTAARLWAKRERHARLLIRNSYEEMGGVGGALARHAEEIMARITREEQRLTREVFRHLVTAEGTRAVLTRPELIQVLGASSQTEAVIEKLIAERLLVASEAEGGAEQIEIVHEALLKAWPRLVKWRQEDAEGVRLRDQLRSAARQWEERGRSNGLLWRDDALKEYELWRSRYHGQLTGVEEAFAAASLSEVTRGRRKRNIALSTAVSALIAGLIALLWFNAQIKQRLLESYEEQGRQELLDGNLLRASVYLSEAYRQGGDSVSLRYMLAQAMRPVDAQLLTLEGHNDIVVSSDFSPDGTRIATAGYDKTVKIWDAATAKLLTSLNGHESLVNSVVFSPDGKRVVTTAAGVVAKVWDVESGRLIASFEAPSLTVSIITDSRNISATVSDIKKFFRLGSPNEKYSGIASAFSPDGTRIVTVNGNKSASVWESQTGKSIMNLYSPNNIYSARFSPDGNSILTSTQSTLTIWDADTGQLKGDPIEVNSNVNSAEFSPDGKRIVTGGGKEAKVWDIATHRLLVTMKGHTDNVISAAFSPDGRQIVTAGYDRVAKIWEAETGQFLSSLEGHTNYVTSAAFSRDGKIIVTTSADGTAKVWSARTGKFHFGYMDRPDIYIFNKVLSAEFTPYGERIISKGVSEVDEVKVWDGVSGKLLLTLEGSVNTLSARFSPDGNRIATVGKDQNIRVWNAQNGEQIAHWFDQANGMKASVSFSPDGRHIITTCNKIAKVWDVAKGELLITLVGHSDILSSATFSPDCKMIVTTSWDKTAMVWDAAIGKPLFSLVGHTGSVMSAAFSPDCKRIVTASVDKTAKVWDVASAKMLDSLEGHTDSLFSAAFSPDGLRIVTLGKDPSVKIWDSPSGKLLTSFMRVEEPGNMIIFSEDIVSTIFNSDGTRVIFSRWKNAEMWDTRFETRNPEEIAEIVKKRVPFRLEQGRLIPIVNNAQLRNSQSTPEPEEEKPRTEQEKPITAEVSKKTGILVGKVADDKYSPLQNATVEIEIKRDDGKERLEKKTDSKGEFRFESIPPGRYNIRVRKMGYKTASIKDVIVPLNVVTPLTTAKIILKKERE
jgi:WD40 repeat protein/serine/threonine protein kinase